ncbi:MULTISPECIES: FAD-dependent monooxygenase [unclassified Nocardia]|uniref:FAD-dependent monooxygenase n=1 Tax=unclassified Nocardia TaxID=2637762 RepID=UPI001CE3DAD0|nr:MULTISPECIES: FAD-dependent monooxygenase [unclassified Nocardia]
MSNSKSILVCGGGIAGNAVALQLARAGIATTVVERAPAPRPGGQAVDLRGPSRRVAERMGLMPGIRKRQLDERGMAFVDARGRKLVRMPVEMFDGRGIIADIEIARGDLNQVLLDEIDALPTSSGTVDYRYGEWAERVREDADGVEVTFASGAVERFDLVIGADGLHSALREQVFGPDESIVENLGGYISFFTVPTPSGLDLETGWVGVHIVPGSVFALRPDTNPATSMAIISVGQPLVPGLRGDAAAQRRLIRERLAGGGWMIPEVLAAMDDAPDFYFDELARVRLPRWSRGRVVLLGDAAFCGSPVTGMGTALAIIGAYLLAGEIAATPDDHARAFGRYEELLRPMVTAIQKGLETRVRLRHPRSRAGIALTLAIFRVVTAKSLAPLRSRLSKLLGDEADEFPLPDYSGSTEPAV